MDTKRFLFGTLAGGITYFILGWLVYAILLKDYFESNATEAAAGLMKEMPDFLWLGLGNLLIGALITYIWLRWANIRTLMGGVNGGFMIGILLGLGYNFIQYGVSDMSNLTGHLIDGIVTAVMFAIVGGVIGWVLGIGYSE